MVRKFPNSTRTGFNLQIHSFQVINTEKYRKYLESDNLKAVIGLLAVLLVGFVVQSSGPQLLSSGIGSPEAYDMQKARLPATTGASGGSGDVSMDARTDYQAVTIYMSMEVDGVSSSLDRIQELSGEFAGNVQHSSLQRNDGADTGSINVRVPKTNHSEFLSELEGLGEVESRTRNSADLEEQYTELNLELKNKRQELQKLEELMNSTEEVESLVKIQERMSELRSRIQFLENRLSDLDTRIDYVTVDVNLHEPEPFSSEFDIRDSLVDAYEALLSSVKTIIVGVGYLIPFAVLWLVFSKGRSFLKHRRNEE